VINNKITDLYSWFEINQNKTEPLNFDDIKQFITVADILNIVDNKNVSVKCTILSINDSSYDACINKSCNNKKIIVKDSKFYCNTCELYDPLYKVVKKLNVSQFYLV
jgi:hypothetical protein